MSESILKFPDSHEFINSKGRVIFAYKKNSYGSYDYEADSMFGVDMPASIMAMIANTRMHQPSLHSATKDFPISFQLNGDYDWHYPIDDFRTIGTPIHTILV